jgi:hypothetical protein
VNIRLTLALCIAIIAVLASLTGWTDPLEGGAAVLFAGLATVIAWLVGRVTIPKLTWISMSATIALAVATIAMIPIDGTDGVEGSVVAMVLPLPFWIGLWSYRVGSVAVIAGSVFYVVKIAQARRRAKLA